MRFKNKVVLISGATGGIGRELAKQLAAEEANLALFARREEELTKICTMISTKNVQCISRKCEVTNISAVENAVKYTKETYGRIDAAILTAGILIPNPIQTFDSSIITTTMQINFFGIVYFVEHLLNVMKKQHQGIIAATSTLPDRRGVPGWGAYGASKAATSWFIESLRAEGKKRYNIDFVTIKPGSVLTPMIDGYHRRGAITAEKAAQHILHGIKQKKKVIQFPLGHVIPVRLSDLFPVAAYDALDIDMLKGEDYPEVEEK